MPDPIRQALQAAKVRVPDTSARKRPEEPSWNEYSVLAYDGLQPTQIVLRLTEQEGLDRWEATALPFRLDARADTDDRRNDKIPFLPDDPTRYVDERRYVVDPMAGKHVFFGLWTGGPVRMGIDKRTGTREVTRVLTRTFCAGHGYVVDEHGNYVAAFKVGDSFNTKPDGSGEEIDASAVREYLSADDALKYHRPALGTKLSPYMMFRSDFPASYTREVRWREFTHESIQFLDPLGLRPENRTRLSAIVTSHFYELAGESVTDASCRVDDNTNTVIFTAAVTYSQLGEPDSAEDLFRLPCLETCDRETLRMFGWGQLRNGEGYKYVHMFRWPRLRDSPRTRAALEFLNDNAPTERVVELGPDGSDSDSDPDEVEIVPKSDSFVLGLLARHGMLPGEDGKRAWHGYEDKPAISKDGTQLDRTGRLVTSAKAVSSDSDGDDVPVQSYRVAKQHVEPDQDGSLSFVVVLVKAEWHGGDDGRNWEDGGQRVLAGVSAPQGYGRTETRVIPSVPRESAIPTMNAIRPAGDYDLVVAKRQTEGNEGHSDVSFEKRELFNFVDLEHTPDNIKNVDNNPFNAISYHYDPNSNTYNLGWTYVAPKDLQKLVDSVRAKLGGNPIVQTEWHPEGYYSVRIRAKGKEPKHVREWCVSADWYKHQTLEQWIGVTVETEGSDSDSDGDGEIIGFYSKYERNADGSYKLDDHGNLIPVPGSLVPFAAIRGDLDANWMGSDPQAIGEGPRRPTVYASTGVANAHTENLAPEHEDDHGDGWSGDDWSDPDYGDGEDSAGDAEDKTRSHSIAQVSPRRNEDGSYDISITRTYPHQRYWEYVLPAMDQDGDEYLTFHMAYRNWASRKAIRADIVSRVKACVAKLEAEAGGSAWDWSDGWAIRGGFSVNQFGLVDAPGITLVPTKSNGKARVARARTITDHREFVIEHPVRTTRAPKGRDPMKVPDNGYWERIDKWHVSEGFTTSSAEAARVANCTFFTDLGGDGKMHEGSKGVWNCNNRHGVQSNWKWYVVFYVEEGTWDGDSTQGSDGNNSQVDSGGNGGGREGDNTTPSGGSGGGGA